MYMRLKYEPSVQLGPMHPLHQLMWLQHTATGAPTKDEEGGGKPDDLAK